MLRLVCLADSLSQERLYLLVKPLPRSPENPKGTQRILIGFERLTFPLESGDKQKREQFNKGRL